VTSMQCGAQLLSLNMPTIGPMGKSVADIELMLKTLISRDSRYSDPYTPYMPYKDVKLKSVLNIGYVEDEPFLEAGASSKRAMRECAEALKKQGHNVTKVQLPRFEELMLAFTQLVQAEGGLQGLTGELQGEELHDELKKTVSRASLPEWIFKIAKMFLKMKGETRAIKFLDKSYKLSSNQLLIDMCSVFIYRSEFVEFWNKHQFDALLTPATTTPAVPHGASEDLTVFVWSYNVYSSLLNLPAGVLPTTLIKPEEEEFSDMWNDRYTEFMRNSMKGSAGMPVGVQVITLPYEDEKCIEVMKVIEKTINLKDFIERNILV